MFAECVARGRARVTNVIQFLAHDEQSEFPTRRNSVKKDLGFRGIKTIFKNKKGKGMRILSTRIHRIQENDFKKNQ
jgi:hypothetical protein